MHVQLIHTLKKSFSRTFLLDVLDMVSLLRAIFLLLFFIIFIPKNYRILHIFGYDCVLEFEALSKVVVILFCLVFRGLFVH